MGKETKPKGCGPRKWYELSLWQFPKFHSDFFRQMWPSLDANLLFVLFGPQIGRIRRKNTTFQGRTSKVEAKMLEHWGKNQSDKSQRFYAFGGGAYGEIG